MLKYAKVVNEKQSFVKLDWEQIQIFINLSK